MSRHAHRVNAPSGPAADGRPHPNPIALRLSHAMQHAGVGASHLARQAGVPPSFILDILNGKSNHPSAIRLAKVACALAMPMTALLDEAAIEQDGFKLPSLKRDGAPQGMAFDPQWLQRLAGEEWRQLRWHVLEHGNRYPNLRAGTQLLVHTAQCQPSLQGWFTLWEGSRIRVRALRPMSDGLWCAQEDGQPTLRPLKAEDIAGKVLWMAHRCDQTLPPGEIMLP